MTVLVGADENCVGSCSLAAAAAWAMSQSGQIVHLKLEPGDHELDAPLRFDASSNASKIILSGDEGVNVTLRPSSHRRRLQGGGDSSALLEISAGILVVQRLQLRSATGAPAVLVRGGQLNLNESTLADNRAGALEVTGGEVVIEDGVLVDNGEPGSEGSAIVVSGGAVTARRCNFMRNVGAVNVTAGSVTLSDGTLLTDNTRSIVLDGGQIQYKLPAPLGRWVLATDRVARLDSDHDGDFPYACAPGVVGDSLEPRAQSGPGCAAACPAGTFCPSLCTEPRACPEGSFCGVGSGSPTPCPAGMTTTDGGRTSVAHCTCDAGSYGVHTPNGTLSCFACPVGANCSEPGATLEEMPLLEAYWRANNATIDVRRCPGDFSGSGCIAGACREGLQGPYCALCDRSDFYYDRGRRECLACDAANSASLIGVATGVLLGFCAFSLMVHLVKKRRRRLPGDGAPPAAAWWRRHAKSIQRRFKVKIKILWSFYQIVTKVGETYMVTYPSSVESTLDNFSFTNLELDGLGLPLGCVSLSGFRNKLLFMMLAPVVVLFCTKVVGWFRRDRSHEREHQQRMQEAGAEGSIKRRRSSKLRVAFHQSCYKFLPMALRVTFLAFPIVSSLAFKAFRCDDLDANDGGVKMGVMSADFSVACWDEDGGFTDEYRDIRMLAMVALIAYPVAVPIAYMFLFWKVRHAVWSSTTTGLSESIKFLTEEYDTAFFFWELLEVLKKLLLVGAMSVVMEGTLNQLVLAFIIVLCFLVMLMVAKPYKRPEDDVIALTVSFALVMFFFFTLILKVQTLTEAVEESLTGQLARAFAIDNETNTAMLLASTLGALVLGSAMVVIEISAAAVTKAAELRRQHEMIRELEELRERHRPTAPERDALTRVLAHEEVPDAVKRSMIDVAEIKFSQTRLGGGAFGEVWHANLNGTPVAVKKLHRAKIDEANLRAFRAEFELQLSLRHPNLVQVIGGCWTLEDVNVCIVLELCEKGTLHHLLQKEPTRSSLSWAKHKLNIASGIARAMAYLHAQRPPVIHRDLKPENVLVDDGYNAKIADFGCSREMDATRTMETAGTPLYSAPELLRKEHYDEKVDVWSFACVLESLHTHCHVYGYGEGADGGGADDLLSRVENDQVRPSTQGLLSDIIERCSRYDPEERCSFAEAVELLGASELAAQATRLPPGPGEAHPAPSQPMPAQRLPPAAQLGRSLVPPPAVGAAACSSASRAGLGQSTNAPRASAVAGCSRTNGGANGSISSAEASRARRKSILFGWNDDQKADKDRPERVFGHESSRRKHTALRESSAQAQRRRSKDTTVVGAAFVGRLRNLSRGGSRSSRDASGSSDGAAPVAPQDASVVRV